MTQQTGWMQFQRGPACSARVGYSGDNVAAACYALATDIADRERTPVGIWYRDGWHVVSDIAPDIDETDTRESEGWELIAVIDPEESAAAS